VSVEALLFVRGLRLGAPARKLVLMTLADRADEGFSCYPGVPLISAECELRPRMVQRHLAWLREHGYVSDRERWAQDGSQISNRYFLHGPWDGYGGTGEPFERVTYPEYRPVDGDFRFGTKAAQGVYSSTPPRVYSSTPPPRTGVRRGGVSDDAPPVHPDTPMDVPGDVPNGVLEDTPGAYWSAPKASEEASEEAPPPPPVVTAEDARGRASEQKQKGAASPRDLPRAPGGTAGTPAAGGPDEDGSAGQLPTTPEQRHLAMARDVVARLPRWLQPGDEADRQAATVVIAVKLTEGYPVPVVLQELSGNPPGEPIAAKAKFIGARLRRMAPWVPPARAATDRAALDEINARKAQQAGVPAPDTTEARAAMAAARERARTPTTQQQEVDGGPADS
jgi:hypothetical protein